MKKIFHKQSFFFLLLIGCCISGNLFAQSNVTEDFSRTTANLTGIGGANTGTSSPVKWISSQANTTSGFISSAGPFTGNGLTFNNPTSGTATPIMYGQIAGTSFSIGSNTWEWTFLYQTPASVTPADNNGATVTGNNWRFWVNANGTDPTVGGFKGYYVTQDGTNLVFTQYAFGSRTQEATFAVSANTQYIIRVVHDTGGGGEWQFYATPYTGSSSFPTTSLGANYDQLGGTYTYSFFQASVSSSANNGIFQWDNVSMYQATATITGFNAYSNGITQGSISYGQTGIVLFGFGVTALGSFAINQIQIPSNVSVNPYFSGATAKLYRSSDQFFSDAVPVSGTTISFPSSYVSITGLTESIVNTTTYYFLVADFTQGLSFTAPATIQFNFASGSTSIIQSSPYTVYNTYSTSNGNMFSVALTYDWRGGTSNDFATGSNFRTLLNGAAGVPASGTIVRIGGVAYTYAPSINTSAAIGGLTFGTAVPPVLTIASGKTLTLNGDLNVVSNSNATITGPGTLTIASTAVTSNLAALSILNLNTNATVNNAGILTMASTSALNVTGSSTLANTGTFTLQSDASGSATIGPVTGTITGTYQAQRYVQGNSSTSYRGYRTITSPVSTAGLISLDYLSNNTIVTGATTTGGGAVGGNPTIYLYNETLPVNNSTFVSGNFVGVTNTTSTTLSTLSGSTPGTTTLPAGNGFFMFFRGDKTTNAANKTTAPYAPADNVTFTASGSLNTGDIVVKDWFTSASPILSYTNSNVIAKGFNLVGNPYASSIDWDQWNTSKIQVANISSTIYVYNTVTKTYATYTAGNSGVGTGFTGSIANVIPSGQGFFVLASGTGPTLTFTESAKITTQVPSANLVLAALPHVTTQPLQYLRVQLLKDSVNREDALIFLKSNADPKFVLNEDGVYLKGSSSLNFSTMSSDKVALAINKMALPQQSQTIPLNVNVTASGQYQLNLTEAVNIPTLYDVWLMDAYQKDSLDFKHSPVYSFNANTADTTTFGSKRFSLVIRQNAALACHLLSFNVVKAGSTVQLSWTTENENNYTTFIVQRSTDGGKTFTAIDSLLSTGISAYGSTDLNPVNGKNLYRLKLVDISGNITYSSVITIVFGSLSNSTANNNISVYPNPAHSTLNLAINQQNTNNAVTYTYKITITNSAGVTIKTATSSQPAWQGDVSGLAPGTYFLQVINQNDNTVTGTSTFIKL